MIASAAVRTTVDALRELVARSMGPGFTVTAIRAEQLGRALDPFLAVDVFSMAQPFFPPHPHAGFSAVTYLLPESPGSFLNRDSRGDRQIIAPGALHWTEAAAGMLHEETPLARGVVVHGLQIFVNLPAAEKLAEPRVYHADAAQIPSLSWPGGGVLRLLAGGVAPWLGPVQPRTPCALMDLSLPAHAAFAFPLPPGWRGFGLRLAGSIAGGEAPADVGLIRFAADAGMLALQAGAAGARVVLFAGPPLAEPVVMGGPFAMSTPEQLTEARRRYAAGAMGQLDPSF